ncbi:MAG: hypothetical protein JNM02_10425, partial [Anaerolineales bacterium]|nr:hypothetical protein [Anaerolineales bacterium]
MGTYSDTTNQIDYQLRPTEAGDELFLFNVYASTRIEEMALVNWTEEQKTAFLRMQFDAQTKHYLAYYPHAEYYIILREGTPVGRLLLEPT